MKVVCHLTIVGAYNIEFVLNPLCIEYYIIKVNAGLSRSSAFASKAIGYPLAYITAKLTSGIITVTRFVLEKCNRCTNEIESFMVIPIGRSFEEAFQQVLRMLDKNVTDFDSYLKTITDDELSNSTDKRIFILALALRQGYTVEDVFESTNIDYSDLSDKNDYLEKTI
ncbi:unnamed protein product [Rotaria sp. Silwood2]|nr:unnamed protein product [Rotaria sp. Silwood2]CAF3516358.1 unnamed protein product [Rotaria sp. Silwood2]CAF4519934.1 unnamed protein product [Rotaria sp. Silwood2]CAF4744196.1 unnamed protein product [Rotaria sp. Silwood2]